MFVYGYTIGCIAIDRDLMTSIIVNISNVDDILQRTCRMDPVRSAINSVFTLSFCVRHKTAFE